MKKSRSYLRGFLSLILALVLLCGLVPSVFAEDTEESTSAVESSSVSSDDSSTSPESSSASPDSSVPSDSSSVPPESSSVPEDSSIPADSSDVLPDDSSVPPDDPSTSEPVEKPEEEEPLTDPEIEEPAEDVPEVPGFTPLAVIDFTTVAEAEYGQEAQLTVTLNRADVAVTYQWQMDLSQQEHETELLYDYSNESNTAYYFPYFDVTEAELLAESPDATWPGIEMYLDAVEEAGGDAAAVVIENGTPNTILAEMQESNPNALGIPDWQNITDSTYTFTFTEENEDAQYRCVITIVDEAYLAEAATHAEDVYGALADTVPEEETPADDAETETAPMGTEMPLAPAEEPEVPESGEVSPDENSELSEDFVVAVETELITAPAAVALPPPPPPRTRAAAPTLQGQWIVGIDTGAVNGHEYITADALAQHPEAQAARHGLWTFLGEKAENHPRPDGTPYLNAGVTNENKLPVLSAWYGKRVYFRRHGEAYVKNVTPYIDIPAFTGIDHTIGMPTLYKDAVSVLNV